MRQALHELVADVARIKVGEDQAVRLAGHLAIGGLRSAHGGHHGGIGLQLAVERQLRCQLAGDCGSLDHLVRVVVFGGAVGGVGKHCHHGLGAHEGFPGLRGVHGDVRELLGVGLDLQAAVAEQEGAVLAVLAVGDHHDEEAADQLHARGGFEDLQAWAQDVAGGVAGARDHAVGAAGFHHEHAEEQHVAHLLGGLLEGHALVLAQLVEGVRELVVQVGVLRVDQRGAVELAPGFLDGGHVAQDDQVRDALRKDGLGGFERARVVALG